MSMNATINSGPGRQPDDAQQAEAILHRGFREFAKARRAAYERRRTAGQTNDAMELSTRLAGGVTALATDGDFLWLGLANPRSVMLYHRPSDSLVGYVEV